MIIRPPNPRTARNPGRRSMPQQKSKSDSSRALMRIFIQNRLPSPDRRGYKLDVREGPVMNGNTNAATDKAIHQPWLTVSDTVLTDQAICFPVSLCETLVQHLLTCEDINQGHLSDTSNDLEVTLSASDVPHTTTPTQGSGDGHSPTSSSPRVTSSNTKQCFDLNRLSSLKIMCEATGCLLEVSSKDPSSKVADSVADQEEHAVKNLARRWLISTPAKNAAHESVEADSTADNESSHRPQIKPWERAGFIELHSGLMVQLWLLLADLATRYCTVDEFPEVPSLYSVSGGRRFYFDLRDTPWGKRVLISQVTDQHRNVIGIPLEELVTFRDRLDTMIHELSLDDRYDLRTKIPSGQTNLIRRPRRTGFLRNAETTNQQSNGQGQTQDNRRRRRRFTRRRFYTNDQRPIGNREDGQQDQQQNGNKTSSGPGNNRRRPRRFTSNKNHKNATDKPVSTEGGDKIEQEQSELVPKDIVASTCEAKPSTEQATA